MRIGTRDVPILYFFLFKMHQYVKKKKKRKKTRIAADFVTLSKKKENQDIYIQPAVDTNFFLPFPPESELIGIITILPAH